MSWTVKWSPGVNQQNCNPVAEGVLTCYTRCLELELLQNLNRYCAPVKKITVSVDDETYRRARIKAAERSTSVSALVKRFLVELAAGDREAETLRREERSLRAQILAFSARDRVSRDEIHAREA